MESSNLLSLLIPLACLVTLIGASPRWAEENGDEFSLRAANKAPNAENDDGLGSLLLKNLRFRDLSDIEKADGLANLLLQSGYSGLSTANRGVDKRQSNYDVSQLAKMLNTLKARNAEGDGVKLQSLRFGRK